MREIMNLLSLESGWSTRLLWTIADFIPRLALAVVVWIVAWFVAKWLKGLVLR